MKEFIKEAREWHEIFRRNNPQTSGEFVRHGGGLPGGQPDPGQGPLGAGREGDRPEKGKLKTEAAKILAGWLKTSAPIRKRPTICAARWGASPGATPSRQLRRGLRAGR